MAHTGDISAPHDTRFQAISPYVSPPLNLCPHFPQRCMYIPSSFSLTGNLSSFVAPCGIHSSNNNSLILLRARHVNVEFSRFSAGIRWFRIRDPGRGGDANEWVAKSGETKTQVSPERCLAMRSRQGIYQSHIPCGSSTQGTTNKRRPPGNQRPGPGAEQLTWCALDIGSGGRYRCGWGARVDVCFSSYHPTNMSPLSM